VPRPLSFAAPFLCCAADPEFHAPGMLAEQVAAEQPNVYLSVEDAGALARVKLWSKFSSNFRRLLFFLWV
jgi:hypothetical protein